MVLSHWSKRVTPVECFSFLCVVVFACNNGVETGPNATGSGYNGEQYNSKQFKM